MDPRTRALPSRNTIGNEHGVPCSSGSRSTAAASSVRRSAITETPAHRRVRRLGIGLIGITLWGSLLGCTLDSPESAPLPGAPAPTEGGADGAPDPGSPAPTEGGADAAPEPSGSPEPSSSPEPSATPAPPDPEASLERFQQDCEQGVEEWRAGQVDYPLDLAIDLNETISYDAAVDVRDAPLPPDEVIDTGNGRATQESVSVKCTVAARLSAVGDALEVEELSNETSGGWVLQEFTPSGTLEWSWSVSAIHPVDQDLRLELRPAIVTEAETGDLGYSSTNQASFMTHVHIEATVLQSAAFWFETNWPMITAIGLALGAAILGVIGWMTNVKKKAVALRDA